MVGPTNYPPRSSNVCKVASFNVGKKSLEPLARILSALAKKITQAMECFNLEMLRALAFWAKSIKQEDGEPASKLLNIPLAIAAISPLVQGSRLNGSS